MNTLNASERHRPIRDSWDAAFNDIDFGIDCRAEILRHLVSPEERLSAVQKLLTAVNDTLDSFPRNFVKESSEGGTGYVQRVFDVRDATESRRRAAAIAVDLAETVQFRIANPHSMLRACLEEAAERLALQPTPGSEATELKFLRELFRKAESLIMERVGRIGITNIPRHLRTVPYKDAGLLWSLATALGEAADGTKASVPPGSYYVHPRYRVIRKRRAA